MASPCSPMPLAPPRRVAFFGGSFDPPHRGHLAVARAARDALGLDRVLFAPVGAQPLKPQGSTAAFDDRVAMTRLAIAGEAGFAVSLADAPRPGDAPNYSLDTLRSLRAGLPSDAVLFCLMGADAFFGLRQWHCAAEIPFAAPLIVASRPGQPLNRLQSALPPGLSLAFVRSGKNLGIEVRTFTLADETGRRAPFYLLPGLDVEISASAIRASALQANGSPSSATGRQLPGAVADYIRSHSLYR